MHTPGPWVYAAGQIKGQFWVHSVDREHAHYLLARVSSEHCPAKESECNARLIATAPELLQAAKLVLEMAGHYSNDYFDQFDAKILNQLKNSVAKAEQESE